MRRGQHATVTTLRPGERRAARLGTTPWWNLGRGHEPTLLDRLVYLSTGLSLILAVIGVKLVLHWAHGLSDSIPEIQTSQSLVVILVVLALTTIASLIKSRRDPEARAHAGSLRAARAARAVEDRRR